MVLRSRPPSLVLRTRLPRPWHPRRRPPRGGDARRRRRRRRRRGEARVRRKRGGLTACFRTPSWSRDHEQPCSDDGTQPSHVAPADAFDELLHIRLSAGRAELAPALMTAWPRSPTMSLATCCVTCEARGDATICASSTGST